jgi:hypothetical protein
MTLAWLAVEKLLEAGGEVVIDARSTLVIRVHPTAWTMGLVVDGEEVDSSTQSDGHMATLWLLSRIGLAVLEVHDGS